MPFSWYSIHWRCTAHLRLTCLQGDRVEIHKSVSNVMDAADQLSMKGGCTISESRET